MFLNADTLTNKIPEFECLINNHQPHIIGVNEVLPKKFKRQIHIEEFGLNSYEMYAHKNVSDNIGRGSLVYVHNSYISKQVDLKLETPTPNFEEAIYIEIKLNDTETLLCACLYRRGECSDENNEALLNSLYKICNGSYTHVLIMGDLNFPDIDWENWTCKSNNTDDIDHRFIECIRDCYLFQHVSEPTRKRGNDNPSTLDLLFSNEDHMISDLEINAPLGSSDHSILKFNFVCHSEKQSPKIKVNYHKGDYKSMSTELKSIDWETEFGKFPDDVQKQWDIFVNKYHDIEQKYVPRKTVYINGQSSKKFSMPLNAKNLRMLKKKIRLWSKVRKNLASEEQEISYRRLKNQIRRLTRQGKKLLEKNIAKQAKSNPKSFWAYAQSKLKTRAGIPDLAKTDDKNKTTFTSSDEEKANVLQDFFSSVFTQEPPGDLPYFKTRDFQEKLTNIDINSDMVKKKLLKLKSNKSPGPHSIHPKVLHDTAKAMALPLMIIFRTSIKTKSLPKDWKIANISAIFKKGNKSYPNNYRPVSLTAIVCKILESVIRDYIINHMKVNNLFFWQTVRFYWR